MRGCVRPFLSAAACQVPKIGLARCRLCKAPHHERCGLERHVDDLLHVVRPYWFGTAVGQIDRLKPFVQRDMARAEERAMCYRENLATVVALVGADSRGRAAQLADASLAAAMRTPCAVGPENVLDILIGAQFVGEPGQPVARRFPWTRTHLRFLTSCAQRPSTQSSWPQATIRDSPCGK